MPRPDLHNVLPATAPRSRMSRRNRIALSVIAVTAVAGVTLGVGQADAATVSKPAAESFKAYKLPKQCQHRECDYISDDRCEIEDPDTHRLPDGTMLDAYRMLIGYPQIRINKAGQVNVASFEFLGYNEYGAHHFDRVGVYVRIPGTKQRRSQRVTPIWWFEGSKGGKTLTDDPKHRDDEDFVGWTNRGLELVVVGYDRGDSCQLVAGAWDVPWAVRGAK